MSSHSTRPYYERYWDKPDRAPPAHDPTTGPRKSKLREALKSLPRGAAVLDAGCGTGEFTQFLATLGYSPVGIDLSNNAIEFARQKHAGLEFRSGTAEQFLPEFQGRFQAVWSSEVIEHVFDTYGFFESMHRCLAPGGLLVLTTPYHGLIKNFMIDLGHYHAHYKPFGGHIRFFDRRSLTDSLRHCGFTPVSWSGVGRVWPLYKSFFVVARKTHEVGPRPEADS